MSSKDALFTSIACAISRIRCALQDLKCFVFSLVSSHFKIAPLG